MTVISAVHQIYTATPNCKHFGELYCSALLWLSRTRWLILANELWTELTELLQDKGILNMAPPRLCFLLPQKRGLLLTAAVSFSLDSEVMIMQNTTLDDSDGQRAWIRNKPRRHNLAYHPIIQQFPQRNVYWDTNILCQHFVGGFYVCYE